MKSELEDFQRKFKVKFLKFSLWVTPDLVNLSLKANLGLAIYSNIDCTEETNSKSSRNHWDI